MSNLTIAVDDALIRRARMRAIEQGTSLSAKVREFLQGYVDTPDAGLERQRAEATARLMAVIEATTREVATSLAAPVSRTATGLGRRTLRDEIYGDGFRAGSLVAREPDPPTSGSPPSAAKPRRRTKR